MSNLGSNIDDAIYPHEQKLVELNRQQLLQNKGFDSKALINERTGSEFLSAAYAKKMKKQKPDLFVNGRFQDEMRLKTKFDAKVYLVFSYHSLEKFLSVQYKNYAGISMEDKQEAYSITNRAIGQSLRAKVLK